eukprot:GHUV01036973.1.p1 GENE.GHUV01036973.1~~GHUV01036973.1.p1  ORF type:complete len:108 (+),score=14.97 GHUV01036973.1:155-478(+)
MTSGQRQKLMLIDYGLNIDNYVQGPAQSVQDTSANPKLKTHFACIRQSSTAAQPKCAITTSYWMAISLPVDRMNMTGVCALVSWNTSSRVQGSGSVNSLPSLDATYC